MANIEIQEQENIAHIFFSTNEKNILTKEALIKLRESFQQIRQSSAKVLILSSKQAGFFSNGLDPDLFLEKDKSIIEDNTKLIFETAAEFFFLPQITFCAINGHCMGAGSVFALYADYRYMNKERGRIGFPEIHISMSFPSFAAKVLADLLGSKKARDLLLTGKALKAKEAYEIGLVDEIFLESELLEKTREKALEFAQKTRESLYAIKEALRRPYKKIAESLAEKDLEVMVKTILSENTQEGFRSLKENRRPQFADRPISYNLLYGN